MNILQAVTKIYNVSYNELIGKSRKRQLVDARKQIIGRMYQKGIISLPTLGRFFNRDHTTILHNLRDHRFLIQHNIDYKKKARLIEELLNENQ
jgi:chromosomal replication initiator protein